MKDTVTNLQLPPQLHPLFDKKLRQRLLALRRDLHRHPELSLQEKRTVETLRGELATLRPVSLKRIAGTGLVARVKGKSAKGKVVAIRGDIDALPILENTGLEYASLNDGVMHACGHDVHAAWAVGAAHLLAENPAQGDVVIILQPAEERGDGALLMIRAGVLEGVSAIFGGHVNRDVAVGKIMAVDGAIGASADEFEIELTGRGAHGARPHQAKDPIIGMAALITTLQTIVSRRVDPSQPAVLTVGTVKAGTATNIIPDTASLSGTLRATDHATRAILQSELRKMTSNIAAAHNLRAKVTINEGSPPLINNAQASAWARAAVKTILGERALVPQQAPSMGGEDFAEYLKYIPGCYLRIGARERGGKVIAAHTSRYYAADESIFVGAAVLAEAARIASAALNASR